MNKTRYTVETLRSGQPKAYADSEYEYRITVEREPHYAPGAWRPWLICGPPTDEETEQYQREWARGLVRQLCQGFREKGDDDGIEEGTADAHFAATLKRLELDPEKGTITALIVGAYTG